MYCLPFSQTRQKGLGDEGQKVDARIPIATGRRAKAQNCIYIKKIY